MAFEDVNVAVDDLDVFLYVVDISTLLFYLSIDEYKVVEPLAYVVLLGFELPFLVADFFLYLRALLL